MPRLRYLLLAFVCGVAFVVTFAITAFLLTLKPGAAVVAEVVSPLPIDEASVEPAQPIEQPAAAIGTTIRLAAGA